MKFLVIFLFSLTAWSQTCPSIPVPDVPGTTKVCHTAYVSMYDSTLKVPRLVVYELTGEHSLGCIPRADGFHSEGSSAKPSQYDNTGYDLGHMSPAQDNAWQEDVSKDSFSMVNVSPQLPGLNRQEWERLEESVRAWALQKGKLLVFVGPIVGSNDAKINGVDVPSAFYKIVVDETTGNVLAFIMPQKSIAKGDVTPWLTTVAQISKNTGIKFNVSESGTSIWQADIAGWEKAHKNACGK